MTFYAGIDLHSNNNVVVVIDEDDKVVFRKRLRNDRELVKRALEPFGRSLSGVVVESTYNWYWLVDGLMDAGYRLHLANTAAIQQYSGLKYGDDTSDARWLAHLLRLGILPEGHIYPKEQRPVRDLLRKRSQLVRMQTSNLLGAQNIIARNSGITVSGIGKVLGLTILLETGAIERFPKVGDYSSYARCVSSKRVSNEKRKGQGNTKNGNAYLAWAFMEAANFAIRYDPQIKKYYQKKAAKTKRVVALKAVAHKLARASYYILRDGVCFDVNRAFG